MSGVHIIGPKYLCGGIPSQIAPLTLKLKPEARTQQTGGHTEQITVKQAAHFSLVGHMVMTEEDVTTTVPDIMYCCTTMSLICDH